MPRVASLPKEGWASAEDDAAYNANGLSEDAAEIQLGPALAAESKVAELEAASVGDVVGPYFDGESIRLDKVTSEDVADSTVKCRHILLKTDDINDDAQLAVLEARADSLKRRLRAGDAFADLVNKHSEDPGSKATGGGAGVQAGPHGQAVRGLLLRQPRRQDWHRQDQLRPAPHRGARPAVDG